MKKKKNIEIINNNIRSLKEKWMENLRSFIRGWASGMPLVFLIVAIFTMNCLRTAPSPREYQNARLSDKLLGKLLRELGPCEVETILAAPSSEFSTPVAPGAGCPVPSVGAAGLSNFEFLTMLNRIPQDKLIGVLREIGAAKTVKFVRALRRHGCNFQDPAKPTIPTNELILPTMPLSKVDELCTKERYDYIGFLVDLLDRVSESERLGILVKNKNLGGTAATEANMNLYLEAIAYLGVYLTRSDEAEGLNKLVSLINKTAVANDTAHLVNNYAKRMEIDILTGGSLAGKTCDNRVYPAANLSDPNYLYIPADCGAGGQPKNMTNGSVDFIELKRLISVLLKLDDPNKIFPLVDGERSLDINNSAKQKDYLENRLIPVLRGPDCNSAPYTSNPLNTVYCSATGLDLDNDKWVNRLIFLVNEIPDVLKMRDLMREIDLTAYPTAITNLVEVVGRVDFSGQTLNSAAPLVAQTEPDGYRDSPCGSNGANTKPWATLMGPNPDNAMRTLVYLVNNVGDQKKVIDLLQKSSSPERLASVLDDVAYTSIAADDSTTCDLTAAGQKLGSIINTISLSKVPILADVVSNTANVKKVSFLVNYLTIANAQKMGTVVDGLNNSTNIMELFNQGSDSKELDLSTFPNTENGAVRTIAFTIDNMNNLTALSELVNESNPTNITDLMNDVAVGSTCTATDCIAGKKLVKVINNAEETKDVVYLLSNVTQVSKISNIINELNVGTWPVPSDPLVDAYYDGTGKMAQLINVVAGKCSVANAYTRSRCTDANGTWQNVYESNPCSNTEGNCWDNTVGNRKNATEMGKIINLIEYGPSPTELTKLIKGTNDIVQMGILVRMVKNSSNLVAVVDLVSGGPISNTHNGYASTDDMLKLVNAFPNFYTGTLAQKREKARIDMRKLAAVMDSFVVSATELNGLAPHVGKYITASTDQETVADLLGSYDNYPNDPGLATFKNKGVGPDILAMLIATLSETDVDNNQLPDSAERMGKVMNGMNASIQYNGANISRKEALVRLLLVNPAGNNQTFKPNLYTPPVTDVYYPAIGPYHLGVVMNRANSHTSLLQLLNGTDMTDALVTIGCVDHVGDYDGDGNYDGKTVTANGIVYPNPDFKTPCSATPGYNW